MPTFNDLYYTDIGNIRLEPEYTNQFNLGFQYGNTFDRSRIRSLRLQADAYYIEVTDKIVAIPKGNSQYRWMMMNLGYVEIRGMDVSVQAEWHFPPDLYISTGLNYSHQRAQELTDAQSPWYGGQIAYIPRHNGSAVFNGQWRTWDFNYSFIYVGERHHNSANIPANYEQPWYTHDLTLGKSFRFDKRGGKFSAEINNLLNQYYDVVLNYPMPGRNYKIIIKIEL